VARLVTALRDLGDPAARPRWGRASAGVDHMGATLADAVLQAGVHYEHVVRPRVLRILRDYPAVPTTSQWLALIRTAGPGPLLGITAGRKLRTLVELAEFFAARGIETAADLRRWLETPGHAPTLRAVHGVGPKTVSFLKLLVGLEAIAVDVHVGRFVRALGVRTTDPDEIERRLAAAGRHLGWSPAEVDALISSHLATRRGSQSTAPPDPPPR
jgi:hypothetical protein